MADGGSCTTDKTSLKSTVDEWKIGAQLQIKTFLIVLVTEFRY